ncbi:ATP synthase subunit I [bacterium]|nr:ATP synthase subunit I [bacterium]
MRAPQSPAKPEYRVSRPAKNTVNVGLRVGLWQLGFGVVGAMVWGALAGPKAALAGFAGGLIAAISTVYFAVRAQTPEGADAGQMLGNFVRAEVRKWAILMALFFVAITLFKDNFAPVISVFSASLLVWLAALGWTSTMPDAPADE